MPRVFLITGTSSGFGKHLVEEVLAHGDIAVATARKPEGLSFKGTNDKVLCTPICERLPSNKHRITFL